MNKLNRHDLLRKIQEVEFAALELNLYLDTHPNDQKALRDYNMFTSEAMKLRKIYEMNYGPLTNFSFALSQYPWAWVNEPWPWENQD